jgi:hypothetical protein
LQTGKWSSAQLRSEHDEFRFATTATSCANDGLQIPCQAALACRMHLPHSIKTCHLRTHSALGLVRRYPRISFHLGRIPRQPTHTLSLCLYLCCVFSVNHVSCYATSKTEGKSHRCCHSTYRGPGLTLFSTHRHELHRSQTSSRLVHFHKAHQNLRAR